MRVSLQKSMIAGGVLAFVIAVAPVGIAFAHNGDDSTNGSGSTSSGSKKASETRHTSTDTARGEHRLAAARLKVCEHRQGNIKGIMTRSRERSQKQISLFTTIATRTEAFYVAKGKTLSNYDNLAATVHAAKVTAETDLAAIPSTLDCSGTDPKGAGDAFKAALKQEQADLKAYRQAVKDLIAGVKSVQGDA